MKIDVPTGYGSFFDVDRFRMGVQIYLQTWRNPSQHRIRFSSGVTVVGEVADGGFTPQASLQAGFRAFAWGRGQSAGTARMWTPAFDGAGSLTSVDPSLPCADPVNATTPVAGPFTISIPSGARPGGKTVPSPATAFVYGDPAHPSVNIRTDGGILLGAKTWGSPTPRGGFVFAGVVFAYGTSSGTPKLWTPALIGRSTALVERSFVGCTTAPQQGTITLTEHLDPADDAGRFELQVDGVTKAAAVGDAGSTGPISVPIGDHAVSELAAAGTNLDDYDVAISCTEDTNVASPLTSSASSLGQIPVAAGDDWRCDVTSTRADTIDFGSITVGSTPETDHASSKQIGSLGGTVDATSADGTRYSLSISPGALTDPTLITLTPTAVTGLDQIADAAPAAVEFSPSGLTFAFPAMLTITPAPGLAPADFAATWEDGTPGVDVGFFTQGPDGSLVIEVPHFSGVGLIQAALTKYDADLRHAIGNLPSYNGYTLRLENDLAGLPGTSAAVASDIQAIFDAAVKPFLDVAHESLLQLQLADRALLTFGHLVEVYDLYNVQMSAGPPATTVNDLLNDAVDTFTTKATDFVDSYVTACDAPVANLTDWFAVPIALVSELAVRDITVPLTFCAFARIETVTWSNQIDEAQTSVEGRIRGLIDAPAQTPGGIVQGSRAIFPQPTDFSLDAAGAAWVAGGTTLDQVTGNDGVLDLHLQRDPGPQSLTVDGTGQPLGLWSELSAIVSDIPTTLPVHLKAKTDALTVTFRSPPTDVVLPFGQTSHLCVDVVDGDNNVMIGTTVDWTHNGPGVLAGSTSTTNGLGIACIDYHHPAGPVTQGDTATIMATATSGTDTGSDAATLTLQWAHIEIETRPESQADYAHTTNTTVHVNPGELVHVRLTITRSGATPTDPPRPVDEGDLFQAEVESGGGGGLILDEFPEAPDDGLLIDADVNGQNDITWDPGSSTNDTTIRITYPDSIFHDIPPVFATVTFTEQAPAGNVHATMSESQTDPFFEFHSTSHASLTLAATTQADGSISLSGTGIFDYSYASSSAEDGHHTLSSSGILTDVLISEDEASYIVPGDDPDTEDPDVGRIVAIFVGTEIVDGVPRPPATNFGFVLPVRFVRGSDGSIIGLDFTFEGDRSPLPGLVHFISIAGHVEVA